MTVQHEQHNIINYMLNCAKISKDGHIPIAHRTAAGCALVGGGASYDFETALSAVPPLEA